MKIALTQRLIENATYPETRDALDIAWGDYFHSLGWIPLPLMSGYENPGALLKAFEPDAVMFTGGNDLGAFSDDPLSHLRDCFEGLVLQAALREGIPVIGVCRGAQFLAHHFGSVLDRVPGHVACRHKLRPEEAHPLAPLVARFETVNSFHQMGIKEPSSQLLPLAWAPDGTLEAFTHREHSILGMMWHPEREAPFIEEDRLLLKTFLGIT